MLMMLNKFNIKKMERVEPLAPVTLLTGVALMTSFATCQELGDFDEVETYTRILLRTKNGSSLSRPRADPGRPLIIDYPFPIHHLPQPQNSEYAVHPHSQVHSIPLSGLQSPDTHEGLTSWPGYGAGLGLSHHNLFFPPKKKKKKYLKKSYKYLIPLLITVATKIAHLLPTLKLLLLALFSFLLFAKKAFLVSVGTFLLVLYEHLTNKNASGQSNGLGASIGLWKDRGQAAAQDVHPVYSDQGLTTDNQPGSDWWRLEGANGTKISPRDGERWRRWWAPQVKGHHYPGPQPPPQLEENATLKDRIKNNLKRIFGGNETS
ncbi:hypothetical protein GE061_015022 [Apolygus lucorum]|uniref:Uncharacterized protein n=1 Tax=Apolygus lucorum TaxID=248454 RepID=A0A8S9XJX0_APOLU|nr:hypothetical protein GE061_015022 [Apolygus lucorum]